MSTFLLGLSEMITLQNILYMLLGTVVGTIFGAIPGLTGSIAISILLPVTFYLDVMPSMALLIGVYVGGSFGGSIPAILIGVPGAPESGITVLDGMPMAKKGLSGKALLTALYSSCIGNLLSGVLSIVLVVGIAKLALKIGSTEFVGLLLFSLILISTIGANGKWKRGLLAVFLGLIVSFIGLDPITGTARFTFNNYHFFNGLQLIPVLIGLFVGAEMLGGVRADAEAVKKSKIDFKNDNRITKQDVKASVPLILSGTVIGTIIGALPGLNAALSSTLTYGLAKKISKHPEEFGNGSLEGVIAPEVAKNGTAAPTLVPLLTLGIPGSGTAAIFLGALLMQGVICGPSIMTDSGDVVYGIFIAFLVCTVTLLIVGRIFIQLAQYIIYIPMNILIPAVVFTCCVGVYSNSSSLFDVGVLLVFMVLGYLMKLGGVPLLPLLIAYLLGDTLESHFRRSLTISGGDFSIFVKSPVCLIFLLISFALIVYTIAKPMIEKKRKKAQ